MKYYLSEIAAICQGTLHGEDLEVRDVVTDSRSAVFSDGAMFVAMRGQNRDAHDFIGVIYGRGLRAFMMPKRCPRMQGMLRWDDLLMLCRVWLRHIERVSVER